VVIDSGPELRDGPLFGTALAALTSGTYDAVPPEVAAASSGTPGRPARHRPLGGKAKPREVVVGSDEEPILQPRSESPSMAPSQSPDGRVLTGLSDLPRQATPELLGRLVSGRRVMAPTGTRGGDASTSSFKPALGLRPDDSVATSEHARGRPRRHPERGLRPRDGSRKERAATAIPCDSPDLLIRIWASRAARRATRTIHRAYWMDAARSESTAMPECAALASEWSARVDGRRAPSELVTAWAGVSLTDASSGVGHAGRCAATVGAGPDASPSGASASFRRSFAPSSSSAVPADDLIDAPAVSGGSGWLPAETASGTGIPRMAPSAVKASPLDAPAPPAPPTIAPPVAVETLPALIPAKSPEQAAPPVASLLAVNGARDEAARTNDDLGALADKIKRILDGQARRHGISV
jgi:hypothetical protein